MGDDLQIGCKLKAPRSRHGCSEKWWLEKTLGLTETSRRDRGQTRAKSIKYVDPSVDGKILD